MIVTMATILGGFPVLKLIKSPNARIPRAVLSVVVGAVSELYFFVHPRDWHFIAYPDGNGVLKAVPYRVLDFVAVIIGVICFRLALEAATKFYSLPHGAMDATTRARRHSWLSSLGFASFAGICLTATGFWLVLVLGVVALAAEILSGRAERSLRRRSTQLRRSL